MIDEFSSWYQLNHGYWCTEHIDGAEDAWNYKQEQLESLIERIEDYPCCMSCYTTLEEMKSAQAMKDKILCILRGEL